MKLSKVLHAWGTPRFRNALKEAIEQLTVDELPLERALRYGNYVLNERPTVMINGVEQRGGLIVARVGLLFAGINAGSCCADDPTSAEPYPEYCVIELEIDRTSGETQVSLLDS